MTRKTRWSASRTCAALLVVLALLTIVPIGFTRHSAGEPIQKTTKPSKKSSEGHGDLAPWTLQTVGKASEGAARRRPPEIQLRGASDGYGQALDSLHFLSQESEGNFEMFARLDAIEGSGLGGLMVRVPGSYGGELYYRVTAHRTYAGGVQLRTAYRSHEKKDAYENADKSSVVALPVFLKLRRVGSIFSAEVSSDGRNYRELSKFDAKGTGLAARQLNVGLVQSSETSKVAAAAIFKGALLQSTEPRVAELVSVGVKEPLVGGVTSSGAIVRSTPSDLSPNSEDVAYLKSDSAYLKVPSRVVFSRGKPSATFEVQSASVKKPTRANLTVLLGGQRKIVKVNILPQEAVASISVRPEFLTRDPRAVGTINLVSPAPRGGTRVLVSSSSRKVEVPRVVIVPAGEKSVQFELTGAGLVAGNNFVTVTAGGVTHDALVDLTNAGVADQATLDCPLFPITPDIATDGQRVYLNGSVQEGARVFLTGDRYNDSPPTRSFPAGEGRERIYCGCQRAALESIPDFDGGSYTRPYFVVPMNAPSGDYAVEVRSKEGDCPAGNTSSDVCPDNTCTAHNLFVAPSYIVSRLNRMDINANSEDFSDSPAEMIFSFSSLSGTAINEGSNSAFMVSFAGSYPGGAKGSGHLTNADRTQAFPQIPLYIGSESKMLSIECQEECKSFPAAREAECMTICQNYVAQGRFSNHFEFSFGGAEHDSSPSKWWGYIGGVGAAALGCALSVKLGHPKAGCLASGSLGVATAHAINDALSDDDDKLGTVSQTYNHSFGGFEWGLPVEQGPLKMGGDKDGGDIDLYLQNFRVGGPQILRYRVKLKSLTVVAGYDSNGCEEPNEVFLHQRAFLYQGGPLTETVRLPSNNGVWSLNTGETEDFGGVPLVLEDRSFPAEGAPESPLLYLELGVWEDDEDKDLMGLYSETIFLPDLLTRGFSQVVDEISPEGLFIRRATQERFVVAHGYQGSDDHCSIWASAGDPNNEEWGRVGLTYQIEVTWLRRARR